MQLNHKNSDEGISFPLVIITLLAFMTLSLLLVAFTKQSLFVSQFTNDQNKLFSTAEAGINDYVYRINIDNNFKNETAAVVNRPDAPQIAKDSALGKWITLENDSNLEYTYDSVDSAKGIVKVTSRDKRYPERKRTVEFIVKRNKNNSAYSTNSTLTNPNDYSELTYNSFPEEYFGMLQGSGARIGFKKTSGWNEEHCNPNNLSEDVDPDIQCLRKSFGPDTIINGPLMVDWPLMVHAGNSLLEGKTGSTGWPIFETDDPITIYVPDRLLEKTDPYVAYSNRIKRRGALSTLEWYPETKWKKSEVESATGREVILKSKKENKPDFPAKVDNLIQEADCTFFGPTQIVLRGSTMYVLSPATSEQKSRDAGDVNSKCPLNIGDKLKEHYRENDNVDVDKTKTGNQSTASSPPYIKFDNVPSGLTFAVRSISANQCAAKVHDPVILTNNYISKTGLGIPAVFRDARKDYYNCYNGDLFIDGVVSGGISFAADDNIYITGGIRYADRYTPGTPGVRPEDYNKLPSNSDDSLGLVARNNVKLYSPSTLHNLLERWPRSNTFIMARKGHFNNYKAFFGEDIQKWMTNLDKIGPSSSVINTDGPNTNKVYALPLIDAKIIAENGAFSFDNSAAQLMNYSSDDRVKLTVFGGVYAKYGGIIARDVRIGSINYYYGFKENFVYDDRPFGANPPNFEGDENEPFTVTSYGDVISGPDAHLNP